MKKITIEDIEKAINKQNVECLDENHDGCDWLVRTNNKLEIELAIKKLPDKQQKIAKMLYEGYTHRDVKRELKVGSDTIQGTLNALYGTIK